MSNASIRVFVALLSLTMVGEGMVTVSLLWTGASLGRSPFYMGVILFAMNVAPFVAQLIFSPLKRVIADSPIKIIVLSRVLVAPLLLLVAASGAYVQFGTLLVVAMVLTFVTFVSQQCVETVMGQLTVAKAVDAGRSARLSQTALQIGVFLGNGLAGVILSQGGTRWVLVGIACTFVASLPLVGYGRTISELTGIPTKSVEVRSRDDGAASSSEHMWVLLLCMGLLAVQLSAFNFFVPLTFEAQLGASAATYGFVSAAAGIGALASTFVTLAKRRETIFVLCLVVVSGDFLVVRGSHLALSLVVAACVGFGFNSLRIRVRQLVFEGLRSKADSAAWGGRMTVVFRAFNSGAPLAFALLMIDQDRGAMATVFGMVGLVTVGVLIPACLRLASSRSAARLEAA